MLKCESLKLKKGNFSIDIPRLEIGRGEVVAIMGLSGSGKTTLLELLSGLETPDSGRVEIPEEFSFCYQNPYLQFFTEKVSEEILFSKGKLRKDERKTCVENALSEFGLDPGRFSSCSPYELSGGEARRVLLASAASDERECLFLDECLAGLDEEGENRLLELLERRRKASFTTVFTSHDPDFSAIADRLIIMKDGRILYDGNPRNVLSSSVEASRYGLLPTYWAEIAESMMLGEGIMTREELRNAIVKREAKVC